MTREDIIRLARDAGMTGLRESDLLGNIGRFAALVAAEKEQQMLRDGWRQCAKAQRTTQYCGLLDAAVKAEREACLKLATEAGRNKAGVAAAIRKRGEVKP